MHKYNSSNILFISSELRNSNEYTKYIKSDFNEGTWSWMQFGCHS